jgi:hypothetical protein
LDTVRSQRKGLSLAETIIGLFLLIFGMLISTKLLDTGLRHLSKIDKQAMATKLAEKSMAELRLWVRTSTGPSTYNFDQVSWAAGVPTSDPDFPGYKVSLVETPQILYSPCSEFEKPYIGLGTERALNSSARVVKVVVEDSSGGSFKVELTSLIADPTRHLAKVKMTLVSSAIPDPFEQAGDLANPVANSFVEFEAKGLYSDGKEVPDLMFDWYTIPLGGTGTVVPDRDGRKAKFINGVVVAPAGPTVSTSGSAALAVHGQYRGHGQPPQEWMPPPAPAHPFIDVGLPVYNLK